MAKFPTLIVLLALATHFDWELNHMDVKTAFLDLELKETVYMTPPEGYSEFQPDHKPIPKMPKLLKCLYGLKQAPLEWYNHIDEFLCSAGFAHSNQDHNLYLSLESIVLLYVDDILIFGRSLFAVTALQRSLSARYSMVDLGEAKQYRGRHMERDRNTCTIYLNQTRYITKILECFIMQDCKGISTAKEAVSLPPCPIDPAEAIKRTEYQSKVGNVMYAMLGTRPDLAFAVLAISKYNLCPITAHYSAMGPVLRYSQATKNTGIVYKGESKFFAMPKPICHTDSHWAGDRDKCRSTSGFVVVLCGGAVTWTTRKQDIVCLSTIEA